MIMIFAGSGASKAVDQKRYPTTIDFFKQLPDIVKNDLIFKSICDHLKTEHGNEAPDIEEILFILYELKDTLSKSTDSKTFFGWLVTKNLFPSLAGPQFDSRPFLPMAEDLVRRIEHLTDVINEQVYLLYATEPTPTSLNKTWDDLLKSFRDMWPESPIEIFTTNYDLVLESALKALDAKHFIVETGRRQPNIFQTLDLTPWNGGSYLSPSNNSSKINIKLTKLHGSVDWIRKAGKDIHTASPDFMGNHDKHIILYPGFKGTPDIDPFVTFHNYFRSSLSKANLIVFIGFAFRDEHINDLLERNTRSEIPIRIIDLADDIQNMPLENNNLKYISSGFSPKGIKEFLLSCTPTKE